MKLIHCPECRDVVGLRYKWRTCQCGRVGGKYNRDGDTATVTKNAVVYGFCNHLRPTYKHLATEEHIETCSNAWLYPTDNGKITVLN